MLHSILLVIHFICAFSIVGLVLLQRGKGAEAGAGFGAGASGTVFGARGASTALSRATAIFAALFMITSLSLTYVGTHHASSSGSSILEQLSQKPAAPSSMPAGTSPGGGAAPAGAAPAAPPSTSGGTPASSGAPAAPNAGASSGGAPPANK
ncbi:MAG: preprotein translocase subunit SecG [Steroidobacteraceae bacterium]